MRPKVSFIISTFNRRDVLLATLWRLHECGLTQDCCETFVVDNASTDGTAEAVASHFPRVRLIRLSENEGSCAKNHALKPARGEFIVFLDDDSFPQPGAIARMIQHFRDDPSLGAVGFTITLPDGSRECSAYPDVFIGCGVGFRRAAIEQVAGLPDDFFMQAEEYDLSLRLLNAGWSTRTFEDLHVTHLKTPTARISARTMRLDVRNNVTLIARHFPDRWVWPFAVDWMTRYYRIAASKGQRIAFARGLVEGLIRAMNIQHRNPVSDAAFEQFARIEQIQNRTRELVNAHGIRRVLFVDYGKNILPYWLAARFCGIEIVAIADPKFAGATYRGVPVIGDESIIPRTSSADSGRARLLPSRYAARESGSPGGPPSPHTACGHLHFDAVIISNSSPIHAASRRAHWQKLTNQPVFDLLDAENATIAVAAAGPAWRSRRTAARIASRAA